MVAARRRRVARNAANAAGVWGLLIAFTVLVVLVILLPVQGHIDDLREEVDHVAEPASELAAEIQYLLARQTSSLRGYLIARDTTYLEQYAVLREREQQIYPELERHAEALSAEVAADVAEIRTLSQQWHSRLEVEDIASSAATPDATVVLLEQGLYQQTLGAAALAARTIRQTIRERQATIDGFERNARFAYGFLFLMASLVAVYMAILKTRVRSLAEAAEARRREMEVAMKRTELTVAGRADLIRGFTHDVKNPLGVADGYAELLQLGLRGELTPPQLDTLARIRGSIRGALEITEELLDLSRLESGGLQIEREPTDLTALVLDTAQHHAATAAAAGVSLHFVESDAAPPKIATYTDPHRVRQILQNLLSNAVKYTPPPGDVTVRVDYHSGSPDSPGAWARVSVHDTGTGIPQEEHDQIFDEFHRVPGSAASGHGLGLAISRRVARLLGGDVTVESAPGEGSTFTLSLPLRQHVEAHIDAGNQ
jgi:signal transduction histidine kinase